MREENPAGLGPFFNIDREGKVIQTAGEELVGDMNISKYFILNVNGIGVIHTCIYVHIYVHSSWLTPASFGSRHDLTLVVRSQTKRQQSAHST